MNLNILILISFILVFLSQKFKEKFYSKWFGFWDDNYRYAYNKKFKPEQDYKYIINTRQPYSFF